MQKDLDVLQGGGGKRQEGGRRGRGEGEGLEIGGSLFHGRLQFYKAQLSYTNEALFYSQLLCLVTSPSLSLLKRKQPLPFLHTLLNLLKLYPTVTSGEGPAAKHNLPR